MDRIPDRPVSSVRLRRLAGCLIAATLVAAASLGPAPAAAGQDNDPPPGFTALFNGRDFSGWVVPEGDNGHWQVIDGVIDYDALSEAPGDKNLRTEQTFTDFELHLDWRIKETPFVNPNVFYVLPDGTHARDIEGNPLRLALPDSDSGVYIRGSSRHQINIWCWPIGSGEMYGVRMDESLPSEVRAAATPDTQADKPVGEWNRFEITVRGSRVTVVLNGATVIDDAEFPDLPASGPVVLQHHGSMKDGKWTSSPSLVQFRNVYIREL